MTLSQFNELCVGLTIDPDVALENVDVVLALQDRNDAEVERLLREVF